MSIRRLSDTALANWRAPAGWRHVRAGPGLANRAIEYLIEEAHYWPASLAKGLILKYGFKPYRPSQVDKSVSALTEIAVHYSRARDEISEVDKFRELELAKSVHFKPRFEDEWNSHEAIEERIKNYHPSNTNG